MTGYRWRVRAKTSDPGSIIAMLHRENARLAREVTYWKNIAQQKGNTP